MRNSGEEKFFFFFNDYYQNIKTDARTELKGTIM